MQTNEMVEKKKAKWDGVEIPGLINVGEIKLTKDTVVLPRFDSKTKLSSEIETLPDIVLTYVVDRQTNALTFCRDFHENKEIKDLELIRTDAHGDSFEPTSYTGCACYDITEPEYNAETPGLATITITVTPSARKRIPAA